MGDLVIYHPESDQIKLFRLRSNVFWLGYPYSAWRTLEIAIKYGWIVIGDL